MSQATVLDSTRAEEFDVRAKGAEDPRSFRRKNPRSKRAYLAIILAALLVVAGFGSSVLAYALPLKPNTSWYEPNATSFTLKNANELTGFAHIVNGTATDGHGSPIPADTFAGKTVYLEPNATVNYFAHAIVPIGTSDHPFQGTFDGQGATIDNFKLDTDDTASLSQNVGFFGYVGTEGQIKQVTIGASSSLAISRGKASQDVIENVGMLAGFCAGTISQCKNEGTLCITSAVEQPSEQQPYAVRNIGGVVGSGRFDVSGCTNTGTVKVSETSTPVQEIDISSIAANIGGVIGFFGDEAYVGTFDEPKQPTAETHGTITDCINTGMIFVDTPSRAGVDRFNVPISAESVHVGGIVGYSQGSIINCVNGAKKSTSLIDPSYRDTGYLKVENASNVGGIVGSLRGLMTDTAGFFTGGGYDDGLSGVDPLEVRNCTNYGDVYARAAMAGIAGKNGTYTTITGCINANKTDYHGSKITTNVVGTRWNKPCPSGITGRNYGVVSYCANFGTVSSGKWTDESMRTVTLGGGYYTSGIAGMNIFLQKRNTETKLMDRISPIPEVYGCYNAGFINAQGGMRQRGIVGQNDGYVHDNILLAGTVENDQIIYGDEPEETEASGTSANNTVMQSAASGGTTYPVFNGNVDAVKLLNTNGDASGWDPYWVVLENEYPVLNTHYTGTRTDIAAASVSLKENAFYTGGASIPQAYVSLGGKELIQGVDFIAVPKPAYENDCIEVTEAGQTPYQASILGIGHYEGMADALLAYGMNRGDMATCTVTVSAKTFTYEPQIPTADEVTVTSPSGRVVDKSEYTFALADNDGDGQPDQAIDTGSYDLVVTAKPDSACYVGSVTGEFRIKGASLMTDVDYLGISFMGKEYPWVSSTKEDKKAGYSSENPSTVLPYIDAPVEPLVLSVTYKGHTLEEGVDYKVIYGNPNSSDNSGVTNDNYNRGERGKRTIGCVTVRYIQHSENLDGISATNYSSYDNMFFWIDGTDPATPNIEHATITAPDQIYDGQAHEPVEVSYGGYKLVEGTDYWVTYENNVEVGRATWTVEGCGIYRGQVSGSFEITDDALYDIQYAYTESEGTGQPATASVTGVVYHGLRDAFSLEIPEEVEHDGVTYRVVAIADKAFGGTSMTDDYQGTPANESKTKVAHVSIPASVKRIGSYAFGTASNNVDAPLQSIRFAPHSELEVIGPSAFARCQHLTNFVVPASVTTIEDKAFAECSGLTSLTFATNKANLPTSLARAGVDGNKGAFFDCGIRKDDKGVLHAVPVTIYGWPSADKIRTLAAENAQSTRGAHGGRNFSFAEISTDLSQGEIDVPHKTYTGSMLVPEPAVTLSGISLLKDTDYVVSGEGAAGGINAGTYPLTISAKEGGNYQGTYDTQFVIDPAPLDTVAVASIDIQPYEQEPQCPVPLVTFNGMVLQDGRDYTVAYENNNAPGTATIVLTGKNNFVGQKRFDFIIGAPRWQRLAGDGRLETMREITQTGYESGTSSRILVAAGWNYADALTSSALSGLWNAPIVTTDGTALSGEAQDEIARLANGSATVYLVGGVNSLSDEVFADVMQIEGVTDVQRIAGESRVDTALELFKCGGHNWGTTCIITNAWNYADALSIGSFAACAKAPMFTTTDGLLNEDEVAAIQAGHFTNILVVGGDNSVNFAATKEMLGDHLNYTRLAGFDRFATSATIVSWACGDLPAVSGTDVTFAPETKLTYSTIAVADGWNFPDALTGVNLLYPQAAPLLLVDDGATTQANIERIIKTHKDALSQGYILGGINSVSRFVEDSLFSAVK